MVNSRFVKPLRWHYPKCLTVYAIFTIYVKSDGGSFPHRALREAAKPIYAADRHAKKELKKQVRGVRTIERSVANSNDLRSETVRSYCLAVRSALNDDGVPPLEASGLKLRSRLTLIEDSLERVA